MKKISRGGAEDAEEDEEVPTEGTGDTEEDEEDLTQSR
jgi:hypothetical protein